MRLDEIHQDTIGLLNDFFDHATEGKTPKKIRVPDSADEQEVVDYSIKAMKKALRVVDFEAAKKALNILPRAVGAGGIRSCLRALSIIDLAEHPRVRNWASAAQLDDRVDLKLHRPEAMSFINGVQQVLSALMWLNKAAMFAGDDELTHSLAKALMKRLGLTPGIIA